MHPLVLVPFLACTWGVAKPESGHTGESTPSTIGPDDADDDGSPDEEDCDDGNARVHPGATEDCNGEDDDCDGATDEGLEVPWYRDGDGDGYGDRYDSRDACARPTGYVDDADDCDDDCATCHPGASEQCDDRDNDCDGRVDEGLDEEVWYVDEDGDGYGVPGSTTTACAEPPGHADNDDDCDDTYVDRYGRCPWIDVCGGLLSTCGVRSDGSLDCWGHNAYGESDTSGLGGVYEDVACSGLFACALSTSGRVECWGNDSYGTTTEPSSTFVAISAGWREGCGILASGSVDCWGSSLEPAPAGTFAVLSGGALFTCGVTTSGGLSCWGTSTGGLNDPPSGTWRDVGAGVYHACAVTSAGTLDCWGLDDAGETSPPSGTWSAVASGLEFSCALSSGGAIDCWGADSSGQTSSPSGTYERIAAGMAHACAIDRDGDMVCWGADDEGQATPP